MGHGRDLFLISAVMVVIGIPIAYYNAPLVSKSDSMDISSYVTNIEEEDDCECGKKVVIDFKKPFETDLKVSFEKEKYATLIQDDEELDKFIFTAKKQCDKYPSGVLECGIYLEVTHKFEEGILATKQMKESIYPKKLDMEL